MSDEQTVVLRHWVQARWLTLLGVALVSTLYGFMYASDSNAEASNAEALDAKASGTPHYTFSWPLQAEATLPRGGTTRGAPVNLDTVPGAEWSALQAKNIAAIERDRLAILAMAGTYRTTFDFLEVLSFTGASAPQPYQSWGTEKIYIDSDTGHQISLVHILEMRIQLPDGSISEPMVTKHWRQDWLYEPDALVEYRGNATWQRRVPSANERKGRWL